LSLINIYLDESGDLGWKFDQPYRRGGSSRFLTIASLIVPKDVKEAPKRVIRRLYKKHKWNTQEEKKWSGMTAGERLEFAQFASRLIQRETSIKYYSITVQKENVLEHIRQEANKLYNYMIQLSLLDEIATHEDVTLIPDPRNIKVSSGNSLHDYLIIKLWFEKEVKTQLHTQPHDSSQNLSVQFSDMLSGLVQSHFEDSNSDPWNVLENDISVKRLFFK